MSSVLLNFVKEYGFDLIFVGYCFSEVVSIMSKVWERLFRVRKKFSKYVIDWVDGTIKIGDELCLEYYHNFFERFLSLRIVCDKPLTPVYDIATPGEDIHISIITNSQFEILPSYVCEKIFEKLNNNNTTISTNFEIEYNDTDTKRISYSMKLGELLNINTGESIRRPYAKIVNNIVRNSISFLKLFTAVYRNVNVDTYVDDVYNFLMKIVDVKGLSPTSITFSITDRNISSKLQNIYVNLYIFDEQFTKHVRTAISLKDLSPDETAWKIKILPPADEKEITKLVETLGRNMTKFRNVVVKLLKTYEIVYKMVENYGNTYHT